MSISAIPSSLQALSLSLSQLQDSVAVIAAASQADSAVSSQGVVAVSLGSTPSAAAPSSLQSYNAAGGFSAAVVVGNALSISV